MPTAIPYFIHSGIALMIRPQALKKVRSKKTEPEIKTAPKATCYAKPIIPHTTTAKNTLCPIPGARAMG